MLANASLEVSAGFTNVTSKHFGTMVGLTSHLDEMPWGIIIIVLVFSLSSNFKMCMFAYM